MCCNSWSRQNYFPELSKVHEISYAYYKMCHDLICNRTNKIALRFLEQFYIHRKLKVLRLLMGSLLQWCTNFPITQHTHLSQWNPHWQIMIQFCGPDLGFAFDIAWATGYGMVLDWYVMTCVHHYRDIQRSVIALNPLCSTIHLSLFQLIILLCM